MSLTTLLIVVSSSRPFWLGSEKNLIVIFISSSLMEEEAKDFFQALDSFCYLFFICIGKLRPLTLRSLTKRVERSVLVCVLFV